VQNRRKEMSCQYTDRIAVGVVTAGDELRAAFEQFEDYIRRETLAVELRLQPLPDAEPIELKLAGHAVTLHVKVVTAPD